MMIVDWSSVTWHVNVRIIICSQISDCSSIESVISMSSPTSLPQFTKVNSVRALTRALKKILTQRRRLLKNNARWCCNLRLDLPYFQYKREEDENGAKYLKLFLRHGTNAMTKECDLCHGGNASVERTDAAMILQGRLVMVARWIAVRNL